MTTRLHKLLLSIFILLAGGTARAQYITTIVGIHEAGYTGDGGPAISCTLFSPTDIAFDNIGNMYIADFVNHVIRKVDTAGDISTYAGNGFGAGTNAAGGFLGDGGPALSAQLNGPYAVAVDDAGNLFFADGYNHNVRKVSTDGTITNFAGNHSANYTGDGGPATAASMNNPVGVAIDHRGNVYIADDHNNVIRKVDAAGIITTFAGDSTEGYTGNGGPATAAFLSLPLGVAVDSKNNVYIADAQNNVIRRVDTFGIITDYAGNSDTTHGYTGDGGPATAAHLDYPVHISFDASDNLYIADANNNVVRKVSAESHIITTVAGNGDGHGTGGTTGAYSGDGNPATDAQLFLPHGVAVRDGKIYIADRANNVIRVVGPLATPPPGAIAPVNGANAALQVYPSPAPGGVFTVNVCAPRNEPVQVTVMNVLGAVVKKATLTTNKAERMQLSNAAPGMYFISAASQHISSNSQVVVQ